MVLDKDVLALNQDPVHILHAEDVHKVGRYECFPVSLNADSYKKTDYNVFYT